MAASATVRVQDHSFFVSDREAATPFETMSYSTWVPQLVDHLVHGKWV